MNKLYPLSLLFLLTTMLAACGGGSSGGGPSITAPVAASNFTLTPQATKALRFTWDDVAEETEYRLLENPDGMSGFAQVATIAADTTSYDHVVSLPARINAQYILESCNAGGCTDSTTVSVRGFLRAAIGYFKASNTEARDAFGVALSLSADGNTMAVGAYLEDSNATGVGGDQANDSADASGAVYVFIRDAGSNTWSQQAYVKASNTAPSDYFGYALSLSADGNTLAVGAYLEDSNATGVGGDQANNSANASGAVYVFMRDAGSNTWSQQAYVKASNTDPSDYFGYALSLSADGDTLAVGAYFERSNATGVGGNQADNTASGSGAVYVFSRSGFVWSQQAYVKASNTGEGDYFGSALSLSAGGNTLAVGAYLEDSNATGVGGEQANNSANGSGAVYVFTRDTGSNTWSQQAYVKASNTDPSDYFGYALSLSPDSNNLVVGAYAEDSNATGIGGDQSNSTVSTSGAVYVFTRDSSNIWSQQVYLKPSNTEEYDSFGSALSLSADGNTLAVGAHLEDSNATGINSCDDCNAAGNSGAVYLFTRDTSNTWSQQAYLKASNTGAGDWFGYALSLSADGKTLAVGAYFEDSSATGFVGDQADNAAIESGAVYLY